MLKSCITLKPYFIAVLLYDKLRVRIGLGKYVLKPHTYMHYNVSSLIGDVNHLIIALVRHLLLIFILDCVQQQKSIVLLYEYSRGHGFHSNLMH